MECEVGMVEQLFLHLAGAAQPGTPHACAPSPLRLLPHLMWRLQDPPSLMTILNLRPFAHHCYEGERLRCSRVISFGCSQLN